MSHPQFRFAAPTCVAAIVVVLSLFFSASAHGQSTLATLTGTVADQSGGVLPGATVTVTNLATGVVRTGVTTATGEYQMPNLDAGVYRF